MNDDRPTASEDESAKTLADRRSPAAPAPLPVVAEDRYIVMTEIGHGGLGRVMEARDPRLERTVALKELVDHAPDARARFLREAVITAQLEHPSIVPIHEAGRWPTGEPFYVMKRVSGRTLDVAASAAKTVAERTALLPNIIAVAEAVGYAHSQGVIHRDLKPQNVLVGAFGETVVIDWGLAKRLDAADEVPSSRDHAKQSPAEMTELGTVMGTPSYMPPEQAAGERVDERADVYALGAIIYHVLSGRPPYAGRSSREVIDSVVTKPPRPLAEVAPELPHDLTAIVNKAMAREPAARYPTGIELAQDLKRYVAGQLVASHEYSMAELVRRWLRRWRAPIAVAVVAFVVLIVLGTLGVRSVITERARAEDQRALAEQRNAEVEDLMNFMLFEMRDKLMAIGRVDLLAPVTRKAAEYYLQPGRGEDDAIRHHRAVSLINIGDVTRTQGDYIGALAEYTAAGAVVAEMAARAPHDRDVQRDLASVHKRVGQVLMAQGRPTAAHEEFAQEIELLERADLADPSDQFWLVTLVDAESDAGSSLIAQARIAEAIELYHRAIATGERAIARFGMTPRAVHALVTALEISGNTMAAHGRLDEGTGEIRRALELLVASASATEVPLDPVSRKRDLYYVYTLLGDNLANQGLFDAALAELGTAEQVLDELTMLDPSATDVERDLARLHLRVGRILFDRGDVAAAEPRVKLALVSLERLAAEDPTNGEWQRYVFEARMQLGSLYQGNRELGAALAEYQQMLAIAEKRHRIEPTNGEWGADVVQARVRCGEAEEALGRHAEAVAELEKAIEVDEQRLAIEPHDADSQRSLISTCNILGRQLARTDPKAAIDAYQRGLAAAKQLMANDPEARDNWMILDVIHGGMADAYAALRRWDEAIVEARAALDGAARLVALDPSNADWQEDLLEGNTQLADLLRQKGDRTAARQAMQTALDLARTAASRDPANKRYAKVVQDCADWLRKY